MKKKKKLYTETEEKDSVEQAIFYLGSKLDEAGRTLERAVISINNLEKRVAGVETDFQNAADAFADLTLTSLENNRSVLQISCDRISVLASDLLKIELR